MGKALKIRYSTQEGKRLFHCCSKLDKAIRQLRQLTFQGKFSPIKLLEITDQVDNLISRYLEFLDKSYTHFRPEDDSRVLSEKVPLILKMMRKEGSPMEVIVSYEPLEPLFRAVKSTDVCIRVGEEFGLSQLDSLLRFRSLFDNELGRIEDCQRSISNIASQLTRKKSRRVRWA